MRDDGDILLAFQRALEARGIIPPRHILGDGKLHRCDAAGRNGKGDAAYLLHLDELPAGGIENHRDGNGWQGWRADIARELTPAERDRHKRRMDEARAQRDADDRQRKAEARSRAGAIWSSAAIECNGFPYIEAKHIGGAHGARLWRGRLVLPVLDLDGTLHSLQFIDQSHGKRFLTGGRTRACCYPIGELVDGNIILIAEGYATAATLHEATDYPAVAAFNAGNIPRVAEAIRRRYPAARLVIAADDDHRTKDNPGLTKAREAATLAGGVVAVPEFGENRPDSYTDFNDLGFFAGHDRVRSIIDAALTRGPATRLNVIRPSIYHGLPVPERSWIVADWVPVARATALYGAGGEGKTILAQMLATACALGAQWLGQPTLRCNSILLFCEDDAEEMQRRQADINAHYGCTYADLDAMLWLPRLGDDNALMSFETGKARHTPLFDELLAMAREHQARLIITDTLADIFPGNENDRGQARAFAQQTLGRLARDTNGAALALAHPSRAGMNSGSGESGSTAWIGTFRSQLYLATSRGDDEAGEPTDPDLRTLTRKKSNAARRGDEIELRWRNGVLVPTKTTGIIGAIEKRSAKRVFLDLLDRVTDEGRYVAESSRSPNYAPMLFARRPDREGFRIGDFRMAMEALFAERAIKIGCYRKSGHDHDCLVRVSP